MPAFNLLLVENNEKKLLYFKIHWKGFEQSVVIEKLT